VTGEVHRSVGGDGDRACSDRHMRARYADEIDHEGDSKYRTAAAHKAE
jgi:hypothetical protein